MARMPDNFLDMTLCSPPYDDLRKYKGYSFDVVATAESLFRVTKDGGVVVWVVNDKTKDGDESGTSFRHALTFKEVGFKLWDTMIWKKKNPLPVDGRIPRYVPAFEYMFVFSKGYPKTFNPERVPCANVGANAHNNYPARRENGNKSSARVISATPSVRETRIIHNVVEFQTNDGFANEHPAAFPYAVAEFHVRSWSNEGDLVYDCFMGSGTTGIAAVKLGRHYIGSEISEEYADLARERIRRETELPLLDTTTVPETDSRDGGAINCP